MTGNKKTKKSVSFSESESTTTMTIDSNNPLSKKEFFKSFLEQHKTHDPRNSQSTFSNCYESFNAANKAFLEYSAELRKIKKEQMLPHEKIIEFLKLACKSKKTADTFREKGKSAQANGFQKKAEENVAQSVELYQNPNLFSEEEKESYFDPLLRNFLEEPSYQGLEEISVLFSNTKKESASSSSSTVESGSGSSGEPGVPSDQDILLKVEEMEESYMTTPNGAKVILNREELEQLENNNKTLEKKVRTYKKYVTEITTQVEEILPFLQNDEKKERLTHLLSKKTTSSNNNAQVVDTSTVSKKRSREESTKKKTSKKSKVNDQDDEE